MILVGGTSGLSACDVYDAGLVEDLSKTRKDAGPDGGKNDSDASECVPTGPEICNGLDDDCNGRIDEEPAASAYCDTVLLNASGFCVQGGCFNEQCDPASASAPRGFAQCDGEPSNGCEPYCDCNVCDDAGTDDGGADDAG